MKIRKSRLEDIDVLMDIFAYATRFMSSIGNKNQWINGYPSMDVIKNDIDQGNSYVCIDGQEGIIGTFVFIQGIDPNYGVIKEGRWLNDASYGVIHRIAGYGRVHGMADYCISWCFEQCSNIRIDTHPENKVMRHIIEKNGFIYCGIIYVANGTERLAYQRSDL